ncbi:MAG: exonuclease SbcCD subunit D [Ruminococcaceae bacterium]|nr:exonuclease SbcCD subunit D [Oscillospiraceae bacterium]
MKFLHIADLHIGKRVNEFSMIEDQKYILNGILKIIDSEKVQTVLMAGDIYDKAVPSAEAVQLFDTFLTRLVKKDIKVFAVSGNHDSAERIAFASQIMKDSGVYMSPVYDGVVKPIKMTDEFGEVNIYLLPFIKPIHVRSCFDDAEEIRTYDDAVKFAVEKMNVDTEARNVIVAHQFVTGAERCDSEEVSVGGLDDIEYHAFDKFDYAALGHIHGAQHIGRAEVRYSGTPLKYSFSEVKHKKSVTIVDIKEKGRVEITTVPLVPLHDMREIKGTYMDVSNRQNYEGTDTEDYMHITLTDEEDVPDAIAKLRAIYPNIMCLDYDNKRTRNYNVIDSADISKNKSPVELFAELYEKQNNSEMSDAQREIVEKIVEEVTEGAV